MAWVQAAPDASIWETGLRRQVFLGDDAFVQRVQKLAPAASLRSRSVPRAQRTRPVSLSQWMNNCATRQEALYRAHTESGMTMTAIAAELGLSVGRVSQLIRVGEGLY